MKHHPVETNVPADLTSVLDNYLAALRRGESPSKESLLREHPHLAADLAGCLQTLDMLQDCAAFDSDVESSDHALVAQRALGDYRILREVGRGGMGVVYEAEQISLARRVALKILPFAAVLDPRHLQRFKNEAMAAAHLDHPHIVEVYGIGCERSIHFYAMRFVEGVTLAEVVAAKLGSRNAELGTTQRKSGARKSERGAQDLDATTALPLPSSDFRLPSSQDTSPVLQAALSTVNSITPKERFRRIAEIGIQAAEELDHAHQMGIVHRDIKPSNLMLDERGKLWVTDFGLARNTGDASMTMTGDLVGTLRYMSPEQALAKRITVDHRTDVYSLGITLYELITLQAAFPSNDREETLRQIAFEEPTAPRKLDKSIPQELETIILKAMEKNPEDRYSTARELADDLRRWVEHKPIVARAPGITRKTLKIVQRHVGIACTVSIAFFVLTIVLIAALAKVNNSLHAEEEYRHRAEFEVALGKKVITATLQVIDRAIATLGTSELRQFPQTDRLRQSLIQDSLVICDELYRDTGDVQVGVQVLQMNAFLAEAYRMQSADDQATLFEERATIVSSELIDRAARSSADAVALTEAITRDQRQADGYGHRPVLGHLLFGLLPSLRQLPQTSRNFRLEVLATDQALRSIPMTDTSKLQILTSLADRGESFEKNLTQDFLIPATLSELYRSLARTYKGAGDLTGAAAAWDRAASVQEKFFRHSGIASYGNSAARSLIDKSGVVNGEDRDTALRQALALSQENGLKAVASGQLAAILLRSDKLDEAEEMATKSVATWRAALKDGDGVDFGVTYLNYQDVSLSYEVLAELYELKGSTTQVVALYDEAISNWQRLVDSRDPPEQFAVMQLYRLHLASAAFYLVNQDRKAAARRYKAALIGCQDALENKHRYNEGMPALERLMAYQLLMSPATKWRDAERALQHYKDATAHSDNERGVEYTESLLAIRTQAPTSAIDKLGAREPTMALALAHAINGDRRAALEVASKVNLDTEQIYNGPACVRECELQLQEIATLLELNPVEIRLSTPFLERWMKRSHLPEKSN